MLREFQMERDTLYMQLTTHLSEMDLRFVEIEKAYLRAEVVAPSLERPYGLSDSEKTGSAGLVWEDLRSKLADYGRREREAAEMVAAQRSFEHAMAMLGITPSKSLPRGGSHRFYTPSDSYA